MNESHTDSAWHDITTQEEADAFMRLVGELHDGCLHEMHISTGHFVSEDLRMGFGDTTIWMLLQRQFTPLSAVELRFERVTRLNLVPSYGDYVSIINDATILVTQSDIYWAGVGGWTPGHPSAEVTWISARGLAWRDASDWMGEEMRYGATR